MFCVRTHIKPIMKFANILREGANVHKGLSMCQSTKASDFFGPEHLAVPMPFYYISSESLIYSKTFIHNMI